ncbi:3-phosphoshikimate 1-carboxyvinyltransferase [Kurthia sibirica]|uniref:3-phosphoshikimate 1-carboxyvinyltransferase n=1 Tax=Kurthia sibirica TaxID=202750 RepID=A0A2U3AIR7_9BACL|nr:3-phosphoshikimate 1-carboxyvinyltransferase [Kurthia sibirica]PWI24446.1 3-phosphoshikimate 1-carboxyvinyltransferase [Kurthia sibirica]GEK35168.1 3-phosphoshikimate 1-carboxyvinyltransferase [Kurthia sibirica]
MVNKSIALHNKVLKGTITVPGDKSVSHRSIMFGSIARGITTVSGFLPGEDCLRTIEAFKQLGVNIEQNGSNIRIESDGMDAWKEPEDILYMGNSGTTTRLMLGLLAGSKVHAVLSGDASIAKRPMKRVILPLRDMKAHITGRQDGQFAPLAVKGSELQAIDYTMPVASAQVKSAILLAALNANGTTVVREQHATRNHTELMMKQFGVNIDVADLVISLQGGQKLTSCHVEVPGDLSSAAFFLVATAIAKNSEVVLENVGLNSTRTGILDVLQAMNADMTIEPYESDAVEKAGKITIRSSSLQGTVIGGDIIPRLIDEIPIIALLATQAHGTTIIKDAEELKVKETNRIDAVVDELKKLGATITATEDGMIIEGPTTLTGAALRTYGDHRIGMMNVIASLVTTGTIVIDDADCIAVSYPTFFEDIAILTTK